MHATLLVLIVFAGLAAAFAAVGLLVRDLFASPASAGAGGDGTITLKQFPSWRNEMPAAGLNEQVDRGFRRIVLESGLDCGTMAAALMMICTGLLTGGLLFVWHEDILLAVIGMVAGMALAFQYFVYRRIKRLRKIQQQLPDAVQLLARAVRAGESLDQAIELVGEKTPEPLATEFRRCARQLHMGLSLPAAMQGIARRVALLEMRILTTTLAVHRQTGGNVTVALDRMADVIRDRLLYRRQLRATTAAGRFSALIIATVGPLLFGYMFVFQTEYISRLLVLPMGQALLVIAAVLEIVGLFWIARMLRSNY